MGGCPGKAGARAMRFFIHSAQNPGLLEFAKAIILPAWSQSRGKPRSFEGVGGTRKRSVRTI
jgi:hypothetical protein